MIHAAVRFTWGGAVRVAELSTAGWSIAGLPALAKSLDVRANPGQYGPADGSRYVRAAEAAAKLLGGEAGFRPVIDHPERMY